MINVGEETGFGQPPGAPEDGSQPMAFDWPRRWPSHVITVVNAEVGSLWATTMPVRLAAPRGFKHYRLLTLVPPTVAESVGEFWLSPGTRLRLIGVRDDRRRPEIRAFATEDPATFYLHFGFWVYREYRIDTGPLAGIEVVQKVSGDENLPYSTSGRARDPQAGEA